MKKMMIIRTVVLVIALVNQALVLYGKSPIPYNSEEIELGVTSALTVVSSLWAWYKNNSITKEARQADEYLKELKKK